jgi:nitrate reductase NapE component
MLIAFPQQQQSHDYAGVLCYTHIVLLIFACAPVLSLAFSFAYGFFHSIVFAVSLNDTEPT